MKKGLKYIYITDNEKDSTSKLSHPLIKKLREKGVTQIELIYGSHWATDAGWNVLCCKTKTGKSAIAWLGYTIAEALVNIDKFKYFE